MNSRLDELQAAILRVKLRHLDTDTKRRRAIAEQYGELLDELEVDVPKVRPGTNHAFHLYALQCQNRDDMLTHLKTEGIRAGVHYPVPVHLQPAYAHQTTLPRTEQAALETLSLPMYPELTTGDIERIAAAVRSFSKAHK